MTITRRKIEAQCACNTCGAQFDKGDEAFGQDEEDGSITWTCDECYQKTLPQVMADYRPQAWINDYAVDIDDGKVHFNCTTALLTGYSALAIRKFKFNDYPSDELARLCKIGLNHDGPFEVDVDEEEFEAFWQANGVEDWRKITDEQLAEIRQRYGITLSQV